MVADAGVAPSGSTRMLGVGVIVFGLDACWLQREMKPVRRRPAMAACSRRSEWPGLMMFGRGVYVGGAEISAGSPLMLWCVKGVLLWRPAVDGLLSRTRLEERRCRLFAIDALAVCTCGALA